ncbi:MAG: hypothetical protein EAY81_11160 [Bacteroidetes bacterium]|nr:MAG: hypothetical protein EAY81_11160 [Bacteroidota bacterium]
MMKKVLLFCFFCGCILQTFAQQQKVYKYVVFFTHKDTQQYVGYPTRFLSPQSLLRRQNQGIAINSQDYPVSSALLDTLKMAGYTTHGVSRWLNCAVVFSDKKDEQQRLKQLYGVKSAEWVGYGYKSIKNKPTEAEQPAEKKKKAPKAHTVYGKSWWQVEMIGAHRLHEKGLQGKDVLVAVIDAGFKNANRIGVLEKAMLQVAATYDFVDLEPNVFDDDEHGTSVWSCMAANDTFNLIGTAPQASYLLLRSEDAQTEFPVEEFYWVIAAEFADSAGADIINSSLGYTDFDNEMFNHNSKQVFMQSTWISKGAAIASEKGLLVINSSGNEGDKDWQIVAFPGDVDEVITVGAVDADGFVASFSSIGVKGSKYLKPDVAAPGKGVFVASADGEVFPGNGTSYACPILTGGMACLWPLFKSMPQKQIKSLLALSSNDYNQPNIYSGYGLPDLSLLHAFVTTAKTDTIFDMRKLSDKYWHIAGNVTQPSIIEITILNERGESVQTQLLPVDKPGSFRLKLHQSDATNPGNYRLVCTMQQKRMTLPFLIK